MFGKKRKERDTRGRARGSVEGEKKRFNFLRLKALRYNTTSYNELYVHNHVFLFHFQICIKREVGCTVKIRQIKTPEPSITGLKSQGKEPRGELWSSDMIFDIFLWYNCSSRKAYKSFPHHPFLFLSSKASARWYSHFKRSNLVGCYWISDGGGGPSGEDIAQEFFPKHSDQYNQILNMERNHSLWRTVGGKLNKGWKTHDLLPGMLTKKKSMYISKITWCLGTF